MPLPRDAHDLPASSSIDSFTPLSALQTDSLQTYSPSSSSDSNTLHNIDASPEDALVSALHAAFSSHLPTSGVLSSHPSEQDMVFGPFRDKEKATLEIALTTDQLVLKGTAVDVEPALLSGNLILSLSQSTSFKSITLVFKGKARVPSNPNDAHILNTSTSVFSICTHEWSFLEGERRQTHTLKPGRHVFPFELRIGGSLPSSVATYANGGASISYKLRATAVRPGLAKSNLTSSVPILLSRTFATEALEYQQSLEIENTWPDKLMYSLVLPHKAWAAGDTLTTLVKFAPMAKGVRVLSVSTTISETTKTLLRGGGHLESTRTVLQRRHEIIDGKAECSDDLRMRHVQRIIRDTLTSSVANTQSVVGTSIAPFMVPQPTQPTLTNVCIYNGTPSLEPPMPGQSVGSQSHAPLSNQRSSMPIASDYTCRDTTSSPLPRNSTSPVAATPTIAPTTSSATPENESEPENNDIVTTVSVLLPPTLTPSHALEPVIVSYRARWSVLIANPDGHTSELRCSLPIHILDHTHLSAARAASRTTRRLLLGPSFVQFNSTDDQEGLGDGEGEEEVELPSYPEHVRDRVANAFLPESVTLRVANPWVVNQIDPIGTIRRRVASASATSVGSGSAVSTLRTTSASSPSTRPSSSGSGAGHSAQSHSHGLHLNLGSRFGIHLGSRTSSDSRVSHAHGAVPNNDSGTSTPGVEYMTSELVLSMSNLQSGLAASSESSLAAAVPSSSRLVTGQTVRSTPQDSRVTSRTTSRSASRWTSRISSRAASPDRGTSRPSTSGGVGSSTNLSSGRTSSSSDAEGVNLNMRSVTVEPTVARRDETHVHANNPSSRQQHGIFNATLKPLSSITAPWSSAHSHAHAHIAAVAQASQSRPLSHSHRTRSAGSIVDMLVPHSHTSTTTPPSHSQPHSATQSPLRSSVPLPAPDQFLGAVLLHRAFIETPDYSISSRGFLGGGAPPLETLRDLPTYESSEAAARRSTPALAVVQEAG